MDDKLQLERKEKEENMDREAFLIWGLGIISFIPVSTAIAQYLGLSKIIDLNQAGLYLAFAFLIGVPLTFGTLLHLRFREIGRRHRTFALCVLL